MYGAEPDYNKTFIALHIYNASLDQQDNVPSARWIPTGKHIEKNQTPQGYLCDAFMLEEFPSLGSMDMGGGDNTPGSMILQLKQPDSEVDIKLSGNADAWMIAVIRNWKQVQTEKRLYVNNRLMVLWCRVMAGVTNKMTIGLEVHTAAEKINDGAKVTLASADAMSNTRLQSQALGQRLPESIDPPCRTGPPADQWSNNILS
ncbi:MAG: hypothetical protein JKY37_31920 [Nannocystaceae bacterium]|nr:hypothetical protein [Nannocystaceae bacterium]